VGQARVVRAVQQAPECFEAFPDLTRWSPSAYILRSRSHALSRTPGFREKVKGLLFFLLVGSFHQGLGDVLLVLKQGRR
jgi:hypothetical protein